MNGTQTAPTILGIKLKRSGSAYGAQQRYRELLTGHDSHLGLSAVLRARGVDRFAVFDSPYSFGPLDAG